MAGLGNLLGVTGKVVGGTGRATAAVVPRALNLLDNVLWQGARGAYHAGKGAVNLLRPSKTTALGAGATLTAGTLALPWATAALKSPNANLSNRLNQEYMKGISGMPKFSSADVEFTAPGFVKEAAGPRDLVRALVQRAQNVKREMTAPGMILGPGARDHAAESIGAGVTRILKGDTPPVGKTLRHLAETPAHAAKELWEMSKKSASVDTRLTSPLLVKEAGRGGTIASVIGGGIKTFGDDLAGWAIANKGKALGAGAAGLGLATAYELMDRPGDTGSYLLGKKLFPSLTKRVRADEVFAEEFFKTVGKETASRAVGLGAAALQQGATGAQRAIGNLRQRNIIKGLMETDDIIGRADPAAVSEAMETMARFAPTLSTDPNAVRSYLREAVTYGAGPDYATISNLANTESRVGPIGIPNFGPVGGGY